MGGVLYSHSEYASILLQMCSLSTQLLGAPLIVCYKFLSGHLKIAGSVLGISNFDMDIPTCLISRTLEREVTPSVGTPHTELVSSSLINQSYSGFGALQLSCLRVLSNDANLLQGVLSTSGDSVCFTKQ